MYSIKLDRKKKFPKDGAEINKQLVADYQATDDKDEKCDIANNIFNLNFGMLGFLYKQHGSGLLIQELMGFFIESIHKAAGLYDVKENVPFYNYLSMHFRGQMQIYNMYSRELIHIPVKKKVYGGLQYIPEDILNNHAIDEQLDEDHRCDKLDHYIAAVEKKGVYNRDVEILKYMRMVGSEITKTRFKIYQTDLHDLYKRTARNIREMGQ